MKRPKLCARTIRERDGNRCHYTGRMLRPEEGSLDHVVPRSRGGKDVWENLVWSAKEVNQKKADRLPHEAGLKQAVVGSACSEGDAGVGTHPEHSRGRGLEAVPERVNKRERGRNGSLSFLE